MAPYTDANGRPTTIHDTVFSTIPGSPAYLAKASHHRVNIPEHGMSLGVQRTQRHSRRLPLRSVTRDPGIPRKRGA